MVDFDLEASGFQSPQEGKSALVRYGLSETDRVLIDPMNRSMER